jgi:hypothetical protein
MKDDCNDTSGMSQPTKDMIDINHLFTNYTSQMTMHMDHLQAQLMVNDTKIFHAQEQKVS